MAMPNCPACHHTTFLAWDYPMTGIGTVKLLCCAQCGAAIGVVNPQVDNDLSRIKIALRAIAQKLGVSVAP